MLLKTGDHGTLRFAHVLAELLHVVPAPAVGHRRRNYNRYYQHDEVFMTFLPELEAGPTALCKKKHPDLLACDPAKLAGLDIGREADATN